MKKTLASPCFLAFALGAASVAAFEPLGIFPLIFLTLGGLFGLFDTAARQRKGFRHGAALGTAFGFGLFISGVSWIFVSLSVFGNMPPPLAALTTLLFCLVESLFPAFAGALFTAFAPASNGRRALFFAALWTLAEVLRGEGITGFPWLLAGYSQTPPSPLAAFAPITGVYGVSFLIALSAAPLWELTRYARIPLKHSEKSTNASAPAAPMTGKQRRSLLFPFFPLLFILAAGIGLRPAEWTKPIGKPLKTAILQGNIPQRIKWLPEHFDETLRIYYRLVQENPAQLTILPETAFPALLDYLPRDFINSLTHLARREQGKLILGVVTREAASQRYANSAILLGDAPFDPANAPKYDKIHLLPFGEFVPAGFKWFLKLADIPMSDLSPGPKKQPMLRAGEQKIAINICYEEAFGAEIARALPEATLLVNLSNVAWFGDSLAPAQHLQISQMRALETGRTILRATNTGMTAIIGPDGRVQQRLAQFTRAALNGEAQGYAGTTPFVRWGNALAIMTTLLALLFAHWPQPARK
jgi:apolipoprotein N-acyltransferase